MYFVPSKATETAKTTPVTQTRTTTTTITTTTTSTPWCDVDEYNRRGQYAPTDADTTWSENADPDEALYDDYSCTARIIRFHSPTVGVLVSSPYYWDFYYDLVWYDPWLYPSYGWRAWWSWGYPWYWSAYSPWWDWGWGWGWHRPYPPLWHGGWNPRPIAGNKVGQYRPGPTGGGVRYGTGYRRSNVGTGNRYGIDRNTGNATRRPYYRQNSRNGQNSQGTRRFTVPRENSNSNQRQNVSPNRLFSAPSRSFSAPSRSFTPSRSGGGRSFGGRR